MSIPFDKKVLENLRSFGMERFGSMQKLAEAMGVRPQNLSAYLKGERKIGPKYILRLKEIGFDLEHNDNTNCVIKKAEIKLDISGALELSNTPAARMAQLLGVTPATFAEWQNGTAAQTPDQLAALFNQVVALALSARHTPAQPKDEPQKATG